jgi:dTDP-glucose pyrophosphorylase
MNVLILAAGSQASLAQDEYPLCLSEFRGEPLLQTLMRQCQSLSALQVIVAFRKEEILKYHLDNIASLLMSQSRVISVPSETKGAACTALLASKFIDTDDELLILNGNEFLDIEYSDSIRGFRDRQLDAGVIVFESVHPRYSYILLDEAGYVVEAAEKRPISKHATAGFYWYRHGKDFVEAAKAMIRKDASVGGNFYICPAFNELVLQSKRIGAVSISNDRYHPLKTDRQVERFEANIARNRQDGSR